MQESSSRLPKVFFFVVLTLVIALVLVVILIEYGDREQGADLRSQEQPVSNATVRSHLANMLVDARMSAVESASAHYNIIGRVESFDRRGGLYYLTLRDQRGGILFQDLEIDASDVREVVDYSPETNTTDEISIDEIEEEDLVQINVTADIKTNNHRITSIYRRNR